MVPWRWALHRTHETNRPRRSHRRNRLIGERDFGSTRDARSLDRELAVEGGFAEAERQGSALPTAPWRWAASRTHEALGPRRSPTRNQIGGPCYGTEQHVFGSTRCAFVCYGTEQHVFGSTRCAFVLRKRLPEAVRQGSALRRKESSKKQLHVGDVVDLYTA
jgi:hypothetical protein